jgi:hypothetical protein
MTGWEGEPSRYRRGLPAGAGGSPYTSLSSCLVRINGYFGRFKARRRHGRTLASLLRYRLAIGRYFDGMMEVWVHPCCVLLRTTPHTGRFIVSSL